MTTATVTAPLQTESGQYAMLALDQRESMRAMFPQTASGEFVGDEPVAEFKRTALSALTPYASAVLVDRPFLLQDGKPPVGLASGCGLIVAVDVLHQVPGEPVSSTSFDEAISAEFLRAVGADAIKFLSMWHPDRGADERNRLHERVVELAREAGVASLIEMVVQKADGTSWSSEAERHDAILAAAREAAAFEPDIYKAQVPGYSPGDTSLVEAHSRELSGIVGGDWVVLSNGVAREDFADAVRAARAGGASGFLAGRAIWADIVGLPETRNALEAISVPRLLELRGLVGEVAA